MHAASIPLVLKHCHVAGVLTADDITALHGTVLTFGLLWSILFKWILYGNAATTSLWGIYRSSYCTKEKKFQKSKRFVGVLINKIK